MSLLGIDFGGRRIGIAVSQSAVLATPHSVIVNDGTAIEQLAALSKELEVEAFVMGIPRRSHHSRAEDKFHAFADALRQRTCKPVYLWDEALTTVEAEDRLRDAGRRGVRARNDIDMYAAAVILQSYLDDLAGRKS